ncbi:hypothetical protein BKA67DRAFT_568474 [Truncatella angustata]|uniref:Uncharacterized protein n=1 Tax=Truncatella angustata TaxID=152316 RepID=A0A9P8UJ08_9PEZI|nr:uncharacterized protein BKA67DRAFT_568474 [Truncatella angustata]KAH6653064.1 hypothetical protein BKA67DRAFT_568474 [Truncatella angustata]
MWLHGLRLPKVARSPIVMPLQLQTAGVVKVPGNGPDFEATVEIDPTSSLNKNCFQHICCVEFYKDLSVEEVRLAKLIACSTSPPAVPQNGLQAASPSQSLLLGPGSSGYRKRQSAQTQFPVAHNKIKKQAGVSRDNERVQTLLLQLALLAQKYNWAGCFNRAIATYRYGERQLRRTLPQIHHIQLIYRDNSADTSQIARLMVDYAFCCGTQSAMQDLVVAVSATTPGFLVDYMKRLDGTVAVPGCIVTRCNGSINICANSTGSIIQTHYAAPLNENNAHHYCMQV